MQLADSSIIVSFPDPKPIYSNSNSTKDDFVAVCDVTSKKQKEIGFSIIIAWYYSDNDFIVQISNFIARLDV